jgi:hypothetical protein
MVPTQTPTPPPSLPPSQVQTPKWSKLNKDKLIEE